ncbi:MAG TPA: biotin transporter BioY [Acidobacteriaceae bacterium]|jgi:biotin transport system substrate-specific component|nr:biotin transporter BioY [Acidobacteriaceae bacterium]
MKTYASSAVSASPVVAPSRARRIAERTTIVLLGTLFVAICAHVSIPLWFTPVPVTLQPFAVLLLGLLLSPRWSAVTMFVYLAEGAAGLPVFSPVGAATLLHLFGPTAGYLLSYPAVAWITGSLFLRLRRPNGFGFTAALGAAAIGDCIILLSGAAWLAILTHQSPATIFMLAVAPFVPGEILKVIAAAGIVSGLRRFRRFEPSASA